MAKRVYIACGHGRSTDGSWDPGTVYKNYTEAGLMLPITKAFVKYLRASGVRVYTDTDIQNQKNMTACVRQANNLDADVYVSVHCDYYKAPSGTMPLYYSDKGRVLASELNRAVSGGMGLKTRGITRRTDLYELTDTEMVSCIFEAGSIKADLKKLKKADAYGKSLAKGMCSYLGVGFCEFKVKAKGNLIVRKSSLLTSKRTGLLKKGKTYEIVKTNALKNRGQLKDGGWITITNKYVERV